MSTSEVDAAFAALPLSIRRRIDRAFDDAIRTESRSASPPRKRRKTSGPVGGGFLSADTSSAGGFIVDDPAPGGFIIDDPAPGGFIPDTDVDDVDEREEEASQIPLSLIPTALQILDLPPDDEDVLSVFRNAASGWGDRARRGSETSNEQFVDRKDWRAVCAALLDTGELDEDAGGDTKMADLVDEDDDVPSEEDYNPSDASSSNAEGDADDGDYDSGGFVPPKMGKGKQVSKKTRSPKKSGNISDSGLEDYPPGGPRRITSRQKAECRRAFALFFPDVEDEQLDKKRIMIRDVSRVASLLKEKLTTEDVRISANVQKTH